MGKKEKAEAAEAFEAELHSRVLSSDEWMSSFIIYSENFDKSAGIIALRCLEVLNGGLHSTADPGAVQY